MCAVVAQSGNKWSTLKLAIRNEIGDGRRNADRRTKSFLEGNNDGNFRVFVEKGWGRWRGGMIRIRKRRANPEVSSIVSRLLMRKRSSYQRRRGRGRLILISTCFGRGTIWAISRHLRPRQWHLRNSKWGHLRPSLLRPSSVYWLIMGAADSCLQFLIKKYFINFQGHNRYSCLNGAQNLGYKYHPTHSGPDATQRKMVWC